MKRFWLAIATASALSACSGGNPFLEDDDGGGGIVPVPPTAGIPAAVSSDLDGVRFNPGTGGAPPTLTVSGITFDGTPFTKNYTRNASLDSPDGTYLAFTSQADALSTHSTAFYKEIDGAQAALVVTGGLDGYYNGGVTYSRAGGFEVPVPNPQNADVRYDGQYVGLLNYPDNGDALLPVPPGTDPDVRPRQAGRVYGDARIDADFANMRVKGLIYNRVYVAPGLALPNLEIAPSDIESDGTFTGDVTINQANVGEHGGIFGGPQSSAVAGGLYADDHIDGITDEEEFGIFVLDRSN